MKHIIAVDFDGTIVDHCYPDIGEPVPFALTYLKTWQALGVRLILWTMRHHEQLKDAVEYCRDNGIAFWGVNQNPEQASWTHSPKAYAHLYIDDMAAGCPLLENKRVGGRPFVNWEIIGPQVEAALGLEAS